MQKSNKPGSFGCRVFYCYNSVMDESRLTPVDLGRRGFKMFQQKDGFRFGTDTVLLAWFTASHIREGQPKRVLEEGSNCGACSLLVAARRPKVHIDALEIDADACEVLRKNIELNGLKGDIEVFNGDVRDLPGPIREKQYDVVFMNPPFYKAGAGPASGVIGRDEVNGSLGDFIKAGSSRLVPSSGIMCIVMTARRTDEVMSLMLDSGIKPFNMICVHPDKNKNAQIVLVAGKKTISATQLEIMPPLVLNDKEKMSEIYDKEQTDCFI